jgi:hypothetical protein
LSLKNCLARMQCEQVLRVYNFIFCLPVFIKFPSGDIVKLYHGRL